MVPLLTADSWSQYKLVAAPKEPGTSNKLRAVEEWEMACSASDTNYHGTAFPYTEVCCFLEHRTDSVDSVLELHTRCTDLIALVGRRDVFHRTLCNYPRKLYDVHHTM